MKKIKFALNGNKVMVSKGKKIIDDAFVDVIPVSIEEKAVNPINSALNVIYVSKDLYEKTGAVAVLFCKELDEYIEVFCRESSNLRGQYIQVTSTIFTTFLCTENESFSILIYHKVDFSKVKTQKVGNIKEDVVVVSKETIDEFFPKFKNSKVELFSFYNSLTGENMIVKKKHIIVDPNLPKGSVRISRIQRIFLGFEFRDYIPDFVWDKLFSVISRDSEDAKTVLSAYDENSHIVKSSASYNDKLTVKKILNKYIDYHLILCPVIESINGGYKKNIIFKIADFYVGKSTLSLTCKRPYEIDEGKDIIRLSKNNMSLLGISTMDQVRVIYRDKTVLCRVLELEEKESFKKTNLPMSCDIVAGLPVNVRNKLGIMNIDSCVKIDRDTPFIFRKSFDEQIVPILLTLFSSNFLTNFSVWKTAIISLVLAPIVVYFNLSSKRNMRLK